MRALRTFFVTFPLLCGAYSSQAQISDDGDFFSASAEAKALEIINDVKAATFPQRTIVVKTLKTGGGDPQKSAEKHFKDSKAGGVQIYITKEPKRLVVILEKDVSSKYTQSDRLRSTLISNFQQEKFDEGLIEGVTIAAFALTSLFPDRSVGSKVPAQKNASASACLRDKGNC